MPRAPGVPDACFSMPLLDVRDLTKIYRTGDMELRALDGVSFSVERGEFVCVMGPSGSGKSTMMNILGCLDVPSEGSYVLDSVDVKEQSRAELARSQAAGELLAEAEKEAERTNEKLLRLREEERVIKEDINAARRQLPGLAARERSIDPDLLEQELLMALGNTEEEAKTERAFRELEKDSAADSALEALKAKMKGNAT